ncbi:hypothetical protein AYI69_g10129 [Smittium culicis]|uniref:Uncharacterized protein n=1 Tax=Smittium culicis TaxID=133412 RepID=A0A1R1WXF3_9FUNG|nr:hypothetical protein AYI69_g11572 [Smittium culicis]OMJ10714.1 hypothetical protein AYI69_g10129 [Smittium culicis]
MDIDCYTDRAGISEFVILGTHIEGMKLSILPYKESGAGNLHKFQIHCMDDIKSQTGTPNHNTRYYVMKKSNIVPGSSEYVGKTATISTSDKSDTRSKKQKISPLQQQGVVLDGLKDQWSILIAQGFTDNAINIIVSNQLSAKRRSVYYSTQIKFLE